MPKDVALYKPIYKNQLGIQRRGVKNRSRNKTMRRTAFRAIFSGVEIDLPMCWPNGELWAVEIKPSLTPKLERVFHAACAELKPARKMIIYPGEKATDWPRSSKPWVRLLY